MCGPNTFAFFSSAVCVKEMAGVMLLLVVMPAVLSAQEQYLGPVAAPYVVPPPALTDSERSLKYDVDSYLSEGSPEGDDLKQRYDVGLSDYLNFFPWNKKMLFDANLLTLRDGTPATSYGHPRGDHSDRQRRSHGDTRGPPNSAPFGTNPARREQSFMMMFITKHPYVVTLVQLSLMSLMSIAVVIAVAACLTFNDGRDEHAALRRTERKSVRDTEREAVRETEGEAVRETEGEAVRELTRKKAMTENERKSRYQNYDHSYAKFCPQFMSQEEEVFGRHVIGVVLNDGSIIKIAGGSIETHSNRRNNVLDCTTS